jgi:ribulose-phosphate 3-epimerase
MVMVKIAPSILAADFARLGEEVAAVEAAGADEIHVDVMDGHFVPNLTIGPVVVESLRRVTDLPLDVHLMITNPERYLEAFAKAGADSLTVHIEVYPQPHGILQRIRELGLRAGITLNPPTPVETLAEALHDVDIVLVMSVNAGFGGQAFIEGSIDRIRRLAQMLREVNPDADLAVDGGIGPALARRAVEAGANVLVAGSAIFRAAEGPQAALKALRRAAEGG